jgi:peptidoglycan/xylan/chitin deacetylase (PgdA/CDA1 family)
MFYLLSRKWDEKMTKKMLVGVYLCLFILALSKQASAAPNFYFASQNNSQLNFSSPIMLSTFWNSITPITSAVLSTNETGAWVNYTKPVDYTEEFIVNIYYENIEDGTLPTDTNISTFDVEMKYLYDNGYHSITFKELASYCANGTKLPEKAVLISFDSALNCSYTNAFRILKKYGLTATFFIRTDVINQPGQLSSSMILDMYNAGFEIGDHTKTHPDLVYGQNLNYKSEINDSRNFIASIIGTNPVSFAYPYGTANLTIYALLKQAGFTSARTTFRGDYQGNGDQYVRTALEPIAKDCTANNMYYIHTSAPTGMNNSYSVADLARRYANYTGRNEFEDMYVTIKDDNGNLATTDRPNDSFSEVIIPDKTDVLQVSFSVPKSAGYNLTFRVRTGTVADNPYILAHLLNYIIDGNTYVGNSSRAPTINNSQYYFVNDTGNYLWGFQRISNIYLSSGLHNLTIQHNNNGTTGIGLDYFLVNYNDTVIDPTKYYNSPFYLRGYSGWSNFTWKNVNMPTNTVVGWSIYSSDASNQWGVTPVQTFIANYVLGNTTNSTNITNQTFTEFDPLWTANYSLYNAAWLSTFNYTYDQAANRNMTEAVLAVINQPGVVNFTCIVNDTGMSVDLNRVWINTLGGGNITPGTITPNLLSPDFALSSSRITWDSNIQAASGQSMSGYIMKPYSGIIEPFECNAGSEGWMFYNTSSHTLMLCDGITWRSVILG